MSTASGIAWGVSPAADGQAVVSASVTALGAALPGTASSAGSFGQMLTRALSELSAQEARVDELNGMLARGEAVELHEIVIATEKARLALDLAVQVRNKVVEAYQEIMRMPV